MHNGFIPGVPSMPPAGVTSHIQHQQHQAQMHLPTASASGGNQAQQPQQPPRYPQPSSGSGSPQSLGGYQQPQQGYSVPPPPAAGMGYQQPMQPQGYQGYQQPPPPGGQQQPQGPPPQGYPGYPQQQSSPPTQTQPPTYPVGNPAVAAVARGYTSSPAPPPGGPPIPTGTPIGARVPLPGSPAPPTGTNSPAPPNGTSASPAPGQQPAARRRLYPEQAAQAYTQPLAPPAQDGGYTPAAVPSYGAPQQQQAQQQQQQYQQQQLQQPQQQNLQVPQGTPSFSAQPSQASMASFDNQLPQPNTPMPLYPKATYGSTMSMVGSVEGIAQSFSHLGMNQPIMQPTTSQAISLVGMPPCPHEVHNPPPPIRLSPQAACTMSPYSNCSPTFQRCTMNVIPQTAALLAKSRVPLALYLAPYRDPEPGEPEIPVINTSTIVRCRRCRTYINPYVQFLDRGQRWKCNMCYFPNDVPDAFDFDAASQSYIDRWQRPELNHAVVEFIAPTEYMLRPPQPPVFLFVIDVSYAAVQTGMVHTVVQVIKDSLDTLPNADKRTRVGLITVDSSLHFYALSATNPEPQMLVVSDLEEVFLPLPDDLLVNLSECKEALLTLLDRLPGLHQSTQDPSNALGAALDAAQQLVSPYGGKIVVCQSTIPNVQKGALKPRDEKPGKLDSAVLQSANPFYKTYAVDCSRAHVSVDMFLFPQGNVDVATLAAAPRFTGGNVYMYPGFHASRAPDVDKVRNELAHVLSRPLALETVLRVRASKGLRMSAYHGNFFVRSTDLLALPNVNPDNTYAVEVAIDENIQSSVACFQTALLHTTAFGERRIRVITMALPVTSELRDVMHSVDTGAVINVLARKAIERVLEAKFEDARDAIINKIVDVLGTYKTTLGANAHAAAAQLMAPENLKLLPLLALGLSKHPALRCHAGIPADLRAYYMEYLRVATVEGTLLGAHPTFYPLHRILTEAPDVGTVVDGAVLMPPYPLPITSERLERNGMYLMYDGVGMYLWVSRACDPALIQCVLGASSYEALQAGALVLPSTGHVYNERVANIVGKLRQRATKISSLYPTLFLVKEDGDPGLRMWSLGLLVEDRHEYGMSYPQLLTTLREKVSAFSG
ncbi:hypothetical protein BCR44DRAFT_1174498 [Catenaria anguillulae PL171]|uniref:Sec23/Sec24 trunk domain-domain-containing protein n=1 Tax=Catenaria anguillulae PL171 TaxID=765915 RepID=A0A1Y2I0P7_9FUNG|nr:hypothetical protein BCR44DRAFT_1174498 [Catenaria anguillulae PL171]